MVACPGFNSAKGTNYACVGVCCESPCVSVVVAAVRCLLSLGLCGAWRRPKRVHLQAAAVPSAAAVYACVVPDALCLLTLRYATHTHVILSCNFLQASRLAACGCVGVTCLCVCVCVVAQLWWAHYDEGPPKQSQRHPLVAAIFLAPWNGPCV